MSQTTTLQTVCKWETPIETCTYRLTPFYDVLSAWPVMGHGAGPKIISERKLPEY